MYKVTIVTTIIVGLAALRELLRGYVAVHELNEYHSGLAREH